MSAQAKAALATLYRRHKVTLEGLREAVSDGTLTAEEYTAITGEAYEQA